MASSKEPLVALLFLGVNSGQLAVLTHARKKRCQCWGEDDERMFFMYFLYPLIHFMVNFSSILAHK